MKRSKHVPLLILGSLSLLTGCEPTGLDRGRINQNSYRSIDDCRKDWGRTEDCRPAQNSTGSAAGVMSRGYLGPQYYWDRTARRPMIIEGNSVRPAASGMASVGAPLMAHSTSSHAVSSSSASSRGGFGSTARGFSGGG